MHQTADVNSCLRKQDVNQHRDNVTTSCSFVTVSLFLCSCRHADRNKSLSFSLEATCCSYCVVFSWNINAKSAHSDCVI